MDPTWNTLVTCFRLNAPLFYQVSLAEEQHCYERNLPRTQHDNPGGLNQGGGGHSNFKRTGVLNWEILKRTPKRYQDPVFVHWQQKLNSALGQNTSPLEYIAQTTHNTPYKTVETFQCNFQFLTMQPSCPKGTNSPPSPPPIQCCFGLTAQVRISCVTADNIAIGEGKTVF